MNDVEKDNGLYPDVWTRPPTTVSPTGVDPCLGRYSNFPYRKGYRAWYFIWPSRLIVLHFSHDDIIMDASVLICLFAGIVASFAALHFRWSAPTAGEEPLLPG